MLTKLLARLNKKEEVKKNNDHTKKPMGKELKITPKRIGELGEYKINIQLDQLPEGCRYISDTLLPNSKSKSGYSQIDHVILTSYGIFVIETKNYAGTIYGARDRTTWSVNGKFAMNNPFHQNFGHIQAIQSLISVERSYIISMVSFSRRCTFKVDNELRNIQSNDLIVYDTELSEFIMRKLNVLRIQLKKPIFTDIQVKEMYNTLVEQNITDKSIREIHIERINEQVTIMAKNNEVSSTTCCKVCGKSVSKKVESYCLANKSRFNGYVYCFNHQKKM